MNEEAFVYVIGMSDNPVKIGFAKNLKRRMADLQVAAPEKLILHGFKAMPKGFARMLEQDAHHELRDHRRSGEWFAVSATEALLVVDRLAAPLLAKAAPKLNLLWQSDLGRLEGRGLLHPWARDAVQAYRMSDQVVAMDHAILHQAGFGGVNLFHFVVVEQKSLLLRYARSPTRLAEAETVLAKAVNAAAGAYAETRQDNLAAELFGDAA